MCRNAGSILVFYFFKTSSPYILFLIVNFLFFISKIYIKISLYRLLFLFLKFFFNN